MSEKPSQAAAKERPLVILCVDDEKPALFLRSAVLTSAGYKVLTASSSGEAFQVFRENNVDLVITDHLLVGATGTALAKQIKELRPQVPIVILSGVVDEPEGMAAANLFLSKNAGPTEMLAQRCASRRLVPGLERASRDSGGPSDRDPAVCHRAPSGRGHPGGARGTLTWPVCEEIARAERELGLHASDTAA